MGVLDGGDLEMMDSVRALVTKWLFWYLDCSNVGNFVVNNQATNARIQSISE